MIPDSLAPGIVIRAPDKTSARESGDEAMLDLINCICITRTADKRKTLMLLFSATATRPSPPTFPQASRYKSLTYDCLLA